MALPGVKTTILDRFVNDTSGSYQVFVNKKVLQSVRRIAEIDPEKWVEEIEKLRVNLANMDTRPEDRIYPDPKIYPGMIEDKQTSESIDSFKEWETHL